MQPVPGVTGFRIGFSGYSVKFSPFRPNLLAVASSQYFGISGNGRISVVDTDRGFAPVAEFGTRDGCFDVSFSEASESVIAVANGDGGVRLFDLSHPGDRPVALLSGHSAETYSVDWNAQAKHLLCSASWDKSVRVWDTVTSKEVFAGHHSGICYEAKWSPRNGSILASVSGDWSVKIFDVSSKQAVHAFPAHAGEVLSVDWNKYRDNIVVTGATDRCVKVWDLRNSSQPISIFDGHQLAVRRVRFSPHSDSLILSCSYDMSVKLWSLATAALVESYDHHTEFVIGIDFSNFKRDLVASTAWDRKVALWTLGAPRVPKRQVPTTARV